MAMSSKPAGNPLLDSAATDAVKQWKYRPLTGARQASAQVRQERKGALSSAIEPLVLRAASWARKSRDTPLSPSSDRDQRQTPTAHGFGCGAVYGLQHGFCAGPNSMNSTRVASGS
jgi:hypothetical protein